MVRPEARPLAASNSEKTLSIRQVFTEPLIDERFRCDTLRTRLLCQPLIYLRVNCDAMCSLSSHLEFDFMRLLPVIGQTMIIPICANFLGSRPLRNAVLFTVSIFVHVVFALCCPC